MIRVALPYAMPIARIAAALVVACALVGAGASLAAASERRPEPPAAGELRRATAAFLAEQADERSRAHRPPAVGAGLDRDRAARGGPLLPANRFVALYGAPQLTQTIIGLKSPRGAGRRLAREVTAYTDASAALGLAPRPVLGAFDLVAAIATAGRGSDGRYRFRQDPEVIDAYLAQARASGARLILDIQPGRSTFRAELRALRPWLAQPDVDLALDPEWNVGRRGVPGRTAGSVTARVVNRVARDLDAIVAANGLPPKLLVVHQFRRGSVRGRQRLRHRAGVQVVLNFDGIGAPAPKRDGYAALSVPRLFDGFSLFYRRDRPLMSPAQVLGLLPEPDFALYQ